MVTVAQPQPYQQPLSQTQRTRWYGEPTNVNSINVAGNIPYRPALPDGTPQSVRVHPLLADHFVDTCIAANKASSYKPQRMDSHVVRAIRGSRIYSVHSWASAWDIFTTKPTVPPPGGVWTPDEHFVSGISSAEKRIEPSFAKFVEAFLEAGYWWGGFFRRTTKPSGQSRGPAGMDTPHFEWRQAPPKQTSTNSSASHRVLRAGFTGNDVNELIANLRLLGYNIPQDTNSVSPAVIAAVVSIQGSEGLEVDGLYGPLTHAAVGALVASRKAQPPARQVVVPEPSPNIEIQKAIRGINQRLDFLDNNISNRLAYIRRQVEIISKENK